MLKVKFILVILLIAVISNSDHKDAEIIDSIMNSSKDAISLEHDYANEILKNKGLDNKEYINRVEFREILFEIITRNEKVEFPEFYELVIDRYIDSVPDRILPSEIFKYINFEILREKIIDVVRNHYGEGYLDDVEKILEEHKKDL